MYTDVQSHLETILFQSVVRITSTTTTDHVHEGSSRTPPYPTAHEPLDITSSEQQHPWLRHVFVHGNATADEEARADGVPSKRGVETRAAAAVELHVDAPLPQRFP